MSDIFVSYASEDRERIMPLVRALEKTGWSVFWDRTIPIGRTWQEVLRVEIETCRSMIVVWSKASTMSEWVLEEAEEGRIRRVLFPVLIDDVEQPFGFRRIQAANLVNWRGEPELPEFRRLFSDLTLHLSEPPAASEEEERRRAEELKRKAEEEQKRAEEKRRRAVFVVLQ